MFVCSEVWQADIGLFRACNIEPNLRLVVALVGTRRWFDGAGFRLHVASKCGKGRSALSTPFPAVRSAWAPLGAVHHGIITRAPGEARVVKSTPSSPQPPPVTRFACPRGLVPQPARPSVDGMPSFTRDAAVVRKGAGGRGGAAQPVGLSLTAECAEAVGNQRRGIVCLRRATSCVAVCHLQFPSRFLLCRCLSAERGLTLFRPE